MPTCQICQYKKSKFFHKINKYSYYFCPRCITLFLYPKPAVKQIAHYYKQNFEYTAGEANETRIRTRALTILNQLKKLNPFGKTLLDIGSGYGFFVDEAKKSGLNTTSIEPSKQLVRVSMNRYVDTVYNITFEHYFKQYKKRKFDYITLIHTIEHVTNPQETIQKAVKLLNKSGKLYLETPNLDSHLFYSEKYSYTFLTPPDHIWLFSQKSFKSMLKYLPGVQLEKISTYSYPEHFMGIIKRFVKKYYPVILGTNEVRTSESDSGCAPKLIAYQNDNNEVSKRKLSKIKYLLFDKLLAPLFTPFLNIGIKGSILELYIRKK